MIPRTELAKQRAEGDRRPLWQRQLAAAVTDPEELLELLELPSRLLPAARRAAALFPLRAPRPFLARVRAGDPDDPLLRQLLPLAAEEGSPPPGFSADPLAEAAAAPLPGLLHKFEGRVLLMAAGGCAINCRYCFRRHFPYAEHQLSGERRRRALAYIAGDPTIDEVILSGGDPLMLDDGELARLSEELVEIPHLRRLRVHTRLPVVLPSRVDEPLFGWLTGGRLAPVIVLHVNHAAEIDGELAAACRRLGDAGVPLFNQAVLLAGVNDSAAALIALSERLFEVGVSPYYLHLLDRVAGAAHFEVPEEEARRLHQAVARRLPGYLVPRLVRERPGAPYKVGVAG